MHPAIGATCSCVHLVEERDMCDCNPTSCSVTEMCGSVMSERSVTVCVPDYGV